jgi:hypothetical protein
MGLQKPQLSLGEGAAADGAIAREPIDYPEVGRLTL